MDDRIKELQERFSDLLNYGADDPTSPIDPLTWRSPEGDTCLHYAAIRGDDDAIHMMIELSVDPNMQGDLGNTALHYAMQFGHQKAAQALIDSGADTSIRNEFGKVPGAS